MRARAPTAQVASPPGSVVCRMLHGCIACMLALRQAVAQRTPARITSDVDVRTPAKVGHCLDCCNAAQRIASCDCCVDTAASTIAQSGTEPCRAIGWLAAPIVTGTAHGGSAQRSPAVEAEVREVLDMVLQPIHSRV